MPCKRVPAAGLLCVSCVGGLGGGDGVGGMPAVGAVPFVRRTGGKRKGVRDADLS